MNDETDYYGMEKDTLEELLVRLCELLKPGRSPPRINDEQEVGLYDLTDGISLICALPTTTKENRRLRKHQLLAVKDSPLLKQILIHIESCRDENVLEALLATVAVFLDSPQNPKASLKLRLSGLIPLITRQVQKDAKGTPLYCYDLLIYAAKSGRNSVVLGKQGDFLKWLLSSISMPGALDLSRTSRQLQIMFFVLRAQTGRMEICGEMRTLESLVAESVEESGGGTTAAGNASLDGGGMEDNGDGDDGELTELRANAESSLAALCLRCLPPRYMPVSDAPLSTVPFHLPKEAKNNPRNPPDSAKVIDPNAGDSSVDSEEEASGKTAFAEPESVTAVDSGEDSGPESSMEPPPGVDHHSNLYPIPTQQSSSSSSSSSSGKYGRFFSEFPTGGKAGKGGKRHGAGTSGGSSNSRSSSGATTIIGGGGGGGGGRGDRYHPPPPSNGGNNSGGKRVVNFKRSASTGDMIGGGGGGGGGRSGGGGAPMNKIVSGGKTGGGSSSNHHHPMIRRGPSQQYGISNNSAANGGLQRSSTGPTTSKPRLPTAKKDKLKREYMMDKEYRLEADKTVHVNPFIKLGFPDLRFAYPDLPQQPLKLQSVMDEMDKNRSNMAQPPAGNGFSSGNGGGEDSVVVYDLDSLTSVQYDSKQKPLSNNDPQKVGQMNPSSNLQFESRFESGNLRRVVKVGSDEYELWLSPDINQQAAHFQWFYFSISNMEAEQPYTFNIVNLLKSQSMFNAGMQPVVFSVKEALEGRPGWVRAGHRICYFRNNFTQKGAPNKAYYTLRFTITFRHPMDVCYIAYHFPYTYTSLKCQIRNWSSKISDDTEWRVDNVTKTLAGNTVPVITITSRSAADPPIQDRDYVFLSARVHPGESNASWMMHGSISHLISDAARELRSRFVFKIMPMLNPDGVINGSHRCSLVGQDLNRQWARPNPVLHPTVYAAKGLLQHMESIGKRPVVFCDYHGHSRRCNIFMYGNNPDESWWTPDHMPNNDHAFLDLPEVLASEAPAFSLSACRFSVTQTKESCARVVAWREFNIRRAYTMESTYAGCDFGPYHGYHIGTRELKEMGQKFVESLLPLMDRIAFRRLLVSSSATKRVVACPDPMLQRSEPMLKKIGKAGGGGGGGGSYGGDEEEDEEDRNEEDEED